MPKDKKKDEPPAGAPMWMITYGDLMSLLLTFFVLLLSFATITEEEAFKDTIASFNGSLGFLPRELTITQVNPLPKKMQRPRKTEEEAARKFRRALQVLGQEQRVKVEYDAEGGLRINLPNQILFESGSANLRRGANTVLTDIALILAELPQAFFEVRGHTDNAPLGNTRTYRDNHALSYARADDVARFIAQAGGISLDQFEIVGSGAGQPLAPNNTPEGRSTNRRVDIRIRAPLTPERIQKIRTDTQALTNRP